ncbi:MAG: efflux RND transporter periplasmic adaptor subunit [Planctomycetes bacterium]|nr:efflux RND transporter periplasmic adaptor subunit [Planctomycetota bacterium]
MKNNYMFKNIFCIALIAVFFNACGEVSETPAKTDDHGNVPSNRVAIPPMVRKNLGITFATAEYRPVSKSIRVPGAFELLPSGQYHYPLPLTGRVKIHVTLLQEIKSGDLLMEIDAPQWRDMQLSLTQTEELILQSKAGLLRAQAALQASVDMFQAANIQKDESQKNVFEADVLSAQAALNSTAARLSRLLSQAAALTGLSREQLQAKKDGIAVWSSLEFIPIRAIHKGVIEEISSSSGTWQESGAEIIHAVHANHLRFKGQALQSDLGMLRDGQAVVIRSPSGQKDTYQHALRGALRIGVSGNLHKRLIDVYVDFPHQEEEHIDEPWMRPQVAAMAEVTVAGSIDEEELSIPVRAVISDGLDKIIFRRDPKDANSLIRTKADLGVNNGEWVVVESGLAEHDQVVVDGIYELKLATTGQKTTTGHFHADGTFHEGSH